MQTVGNHPVYLKLVVSTPMGTAQLNLSPVHVQYAEPGPNGEIQLGWRPPRPSPLSIMDVPRHLVQYAYDGTGFQE